MGVPPDYESTFIDGQSINKHGQSQSRGKGGLMTPKSNDKYKEKRLVSELSYLSRKFQHYSLRSLAARKKKQLNVDISVSIIPLNKFPLVFHNQ